MSLSIHRFNDNRECNAFVCGIGVATDGDDPLVWAVDVLVGTEDGEPFYGVLVQRDDYEETEPGQEEAIDHREHT